MAKRKRRRLDSADDVVGAAQGCRSGTRFGQRFGVGRGGFGGRSRRRGRLAIRLPLQFLGRLLPLLERLLLGVDRGLYLCRGLVDAREPLGALVGDHPLPVGLVLRLPLDRKRVVSGKRVSVRVYLGGCRITKKKIPLLNSI